MPEEGRGEKGNNLSGRGNFAHPPLQGAHPELAQDEKHDSSAFSAHLVSRAPEFKHLSSLSVILYFVDNIG